MTIWQILLFYSFFNFLGFYPVLSILKLLVPTSAFMIYHTLQFKYHYILGSLHSKISLQFLQNCFVIYADQFFGIFQLVIAVCSVSRFWLKVLLSPFDQKPGKPVQQKTRSIIVTILGRGGKAGLRNFFTGLCSSDLQTDQAGFASFLNYFLK